MSKALPMAVLDYDYDEEALGFGEPETPAVEPAVLNAGQKASLAVVALGLLSLLLQMIELHQAEEARFAGTWAGVLTGWLSVALGTAGYGWLTHRGTTPGIKHDNIFFRSLSARGALAWTAGIFMTAFYVTLYWNTEIAGIGKAGGLFAPLAKTAVYLFGLATTLVEPLARAIHGGPADRWFLYGTLYTLAILVFGVRMIMKYRHNRYQVMRTLSVMFFQLGFAFLIPNILKAFSQPEHYFSYFWPLKYDYLFPGSVTGLLKQPGGVGTFMVFWGAVMTFVATPILTYFFGKRWYCSWVCGCGGLAETLGDPWRQLSSKSTASWVLERWMIHTVLVAITVITLLLWGAHAGWIPLERSTTHAMSKGYGFVIGAAFSGVIGVGFYPLLGSRVWCRFGCPMAAILGIFQRFFSRFRITTNGDQCMSCGNCSTYCEMGIDVRAYAEKGENIIRASCVGCGVCAAVCPRGVLKLENGPHGDRYEGANNPVGAFLKSLTPGRPSIP